MAIDETDESTCLGQNIQLSLDALLGAMTSIVSDIKLVEQATVTLSEAIVEVKNVVKHYHDSHLHAYPHDGQEQYNVPIGRTFMPAPMTPSDQLLHEYNSNYDVDGNGLIYGTDFKLKGDNIPRNIKAVNEMLKDDEYPNQLTLEQYIATVPNSEKIWHN